METGTEIRLNLLEMQMENRVKKNSSTSERIARTGPR